MIREREIAEEEKTERVEGEGRRERRRNSQTERVTASVWVRSLLGLFIESSGFSFFSFLFFLYRNISPEFPKCIYEFMYVCTHSVCKCLRV